MKKTALIIAVILTTTLAACSPSAAPTPLPTVVLNAKPSSASSGVSASGIVVPQPNASLSFPLTGTVKTVEVKAGDKVTKGQALVKLDTTLWEAKVKEAEAAVTAAQANEKFLVRSGSDQEHIDAANADVEQTQATVDAA